MLYAAASTLPHIQANAHLKSEPTHACSESGLDSHELLGYHTQHLDADPVEFIKTCPSTALCETCRATLDTVRSLW